MQYLNISVFAALWQPWCPHWEMEFHGQRFWQTVVSSPSTNLSNCLLQWIINTLLPLRMLFHMNAKHFRRDRRIFTFWYFWSGTFPHTAMGCNLTHTILNETIGMCHQVGPCLAHVSPWPAVRVLTHQSAPLPPSPWVVVWLHGASHAGTPTQPSGGSIPHMETSLRPGHSRQNNNQAYWASLG